MSDLSEDEIIITKNKCPSSQRRKRQRLLSESSDQDEVQILTDSPDEISIVESHTGGTSKTVIYIEDDEEEEFDDDDDDDDNNGEEREEDTIIEELYDDEDRPLKQGSAAQKKVSNLRQSVVDFFQNASVLDLESIPGVKKKKVEQLIKLRPLLSWEDLNKKIQNHKSAGINEDVVINAVKTMKSRQVVEKLMDDCQRLAQDIGHLVDRLPEASQPKCIPTSLKLSPYQLIGLNWLALLHNRRVNGILADEMGLGKTIQVISFLAYLRETLNITGHHLVIVPASTLDNWEREFDTWCPEIKLLQYYGTQDERARIRFYIAKNPDAADVILTTYNVAQSPEDRRLFKKLDVKYLVFDEAHMLKNMKSSRYQSLIKIRSERRILLTGTPLQNNLVELMSLLVFTMPRMLMSKMTHVEALFASASKEDGGKTEFERERIEQAKKIMKPFVLRRLKEDVLKDLPMKREQTIHVDMSARQCKLYQKLVDSFKKEIKDHASDVIDDDNSFDTESSEDVKKGAGMLMAMRKLSNHPLLVLNLYTKEKLKKMANLMLKEPTHRDAKADLIYEDMCVMHDFELHQLCKMYKSIEHYKLDDETIIDSGKFRYLDQLLQEFKKTKQRCLLFSQFTMMLDIMEEYLSIRGFGYARLDGSTKVSDRINLIDDFNNDDNVLVFLLSTKAGGLGINLTAANVVVIHDIDFNPYNDKQAEDRSHRLGQTKEVVVYKLISKGTIEEGMMSIANEKLRLGKNISNQVEETDLPATKDMRSLLRASLKL